MTQKRISGVRRLRSTVVERCCVEDCDVDVCSWKCSECEKYMCSTEHMDAHNCLEDEE